MKVYHNLTELPKFRKAVLTIGSFDGVHSGHQQIIQQVRELAQQIGGESILITFHPHPRLFLNPNDTNLQLLNTIDEKVELLEHYGIDNLIIVPFNQTFAQQTPQEYIEQFLIEKFNPVYIVIGYDHRFGKGRAGDIHLLKEYEPKGKFRIFEIEKQKVDNIGVSSTKIRKALEHGDVKTAAHLLNHPFSLKGTVVHGQKIGHSIGFPTANIELQSKHKLIPPFGIYAVNLIHQKECYQGMLYIGDRPTLVNHHNKTIEVNIFNFNKNIYGDQLKIEFVDFIREDQKFGDLEQLQNALKSDKEKSLEILSAYKVQTQTLKKKMDKAPPHVAVVILNYNGEEHLQKFLPSVLESTYDNFHIHVADNGSTDESLEVLKTQFSEVTVHDLKKNYGFAKGYNVALQLVDADYFILLNSDVEVDRDWIQPMVELMEKDRNIAAVQPKIRAYLDRESFEYAGAAGGWIDYLGFPFCRGRIFKKLEKDQGQYDQTEEIFWASGAALFIRADLFNKIGGFDGDYFAHMEEIDLCWRLKRAGYKIMIHPQSIVYHLGGGTLQYDNPKKTFLNFRNSYYTILKNEDSGKLFWLLPLRLLIDGAAGLQFLLQGKVAHLIAIIKAHWAFFGNYRATKEKRLYYQDLIDKMSISQHTNNAGVYNKSILWQHFILRKNKFKNIIK